MEINPRLTTSFLGYRQLTPQLPLGQLVASHPDLAQARQLDLSDCFSAEVASAACAFAIARLAQERVADFN